LNQTLLNIFQNNNNDNSHILDDFLHRSRTFSTSNFAMLTQQGKSHKENQDRGVLISPFHIGPSTSHDNGRSSSSNNNNDYDHSSFLIAIFDGHGQRGHLVAQEAVEQFPKVFKYYLDHHQELDDRSIVSALNQTFLQVNNQGTPDSFLLGGCTATVTLRIGSKLYFANVGDSQTILVSVNRTRFDNFPYTTDVRYMTRKDKPCEEDEKVRIERMGGKIHFPPDNPRLARVVVHSQAAKDTIALAMSRSLGDWEWKEVGVIAEPIIDVIDVTQPPYNTPEQHLFLIAASDGMWDARIREFYANQLAMSFDWFDSKVDKFQNINRNSMPSNRSLRPIFKLHDIFLRITPAAQVGYCDDITAIVTKIL
jgi:serine/threonine protein phosphatase PrpC